MSSYKEYSLNHKTFLAALKSFATNKQKFKRYYNDKRLTHQEKNLLRARIALRNFKLEEGIEYLNITPQNDYIKAHLYFLKGTFHNNATEYDEGIDLLKKSFMLFKKIGDDYYSFQVVHTVLITLCNLKLAPQMEFYLKELKKIRLDTPFARSYVLRFESLYLSLIGENNQSLSKINEALVIDSEPMQDQKAIF